MADLELVEKLRERASVTYDEAKEALDSCGDDLLDAVIYLERKGKVPPPAGGSYTSKQQKPSHKEHTGHSATAGNDVRFSSYLKAFFAWLGELVRQSCVNMFEVYQHDRLILTLPVLILVLLLIFCFWVTIPLLIVGLFFDIRYKFRGQETEKSGINEIVESVAEATERIKNDVKQAQEAHKSDNVYHMDNKDK